MGLGYHYGAFGRFIDSSPDNKEGIRRKNSQPLFNIFKSHPFVGFILNIGQAAVNYCNDCKILSVPAFCSKSRKLNKFVTIRRFKPMDNSIFN